VQSGAGGKATGKLQAANHPRFGGRPQGTLRSRRPSEGDGWASNSRSSLFRMRFPQFERAREKAETTRHLLAGNDPNPLPRPAPKVTVKGNTARTFTKSSTGAEADRSWAADIRRETVAEPGADSSLPARKAQKEVTEA